MESLATATNAVSGNNTNSNGSSSSSGYGSATTTPLSHYESHVTTPENAVIPTSPTPAVSSAAPPTTVATTIATVAPYTYSGGESSSHSSSISDGHRQQYQYAAYNYSSTNSNTLQTSNSQQHNPYVGLNYMQHSASAPTGHDYNISEQTTKERSSENTNIKHATHSPIEKLTAYANLSSSNSNSAYKQNSAAHLPNIADMPSKPQATATAFYAAPLPRVSAYDQYKFKMPTAVGAEYANYGCRIPGNSATYQQQQQQYYAAAKSQLSEVNYGAVTKPLSPTSVMRQQMSSLYGRTNTAAYYDKYEKYGSYSLPPTSSTNAASAALPTNDTTAGAATYATLHPQPSAGSHYAAAAETATGSATNWHWNYVTGNYRTLPPPQAPPPPTAIPTAAIPPSNASYLSSGQTGTSGTRDAYYSKFDKYNAYAYHQQQQHQQQQQQQQQQHQHQAASASNRNIWTAPTHQHLGTTITERLSHPTAAYQPPPPPYAPHHFAATANVAAATRQNCCSQSSAYHQQQSCYYPRVPPTQHVSNVYPSHPHAHSHPLQHPHPHHLQQNSQHYGSNKYVTNSILDYPMQSKLKYANTDLMTATAMPYDAAATYSNYNYSQRYAAAGAQHSNVVSGGGDSTTAAYYNDLSLQSTYENYATTQHSTQQQQQHQYQQHHGASARAQHLSYHHPPPQTNHVKNPLLDYRKPANTATTAQQPATGGTTIIENCYMQEPATGNYHHNYENSSAATSLYAIDSANDHHDPDAEKAGVTKNHLSIRDFIATWNDDEEDAAAAVVAANYVESAAAQSQKSAAAIGGGATADNHVKILHTETIPAATQKLFLHEQQSHQQQQHYTPPLENHLQFKGSFSTRPKIHVGITVDSSVDAQYINLPDIIIDIEKANNAGGIPTAVGTPSSSFENFDVEKELDELQIKKSKLDIEKQIVAGEHMKSNNDTAALRMRTNIDSVNAVEKSSNDAANKNTFKGVLDANTKPLSVVAALNKAGDAGNVGLTPSEDAAKVEAGQHNFTTTEQLLKEMEYDSTSLSNESTFEKEYETFINKIGTDVETRSVDEKQTAETLRPSLNEEPTATTAEAKVDKVEENAIVPIEVDENREAKDLELKNNEIVANAKNEAELEAISVKDNVTLNAEDENTNEETKTFDNITEIEDKIANLKDENKTAGDILLEVKNEAEESVANAVVECNETVAQLIETKAELIDSAELNMQNIAESETATNLDSAEMNMQNVAESETATEEQKSPNYINADEKTEQVDNKTVETDMNIVAELENNQQLMTSPATSPTNTLIDQPSHNHKFYKRKRKLIDDANNEELHCAIEEATPPAPQQNSSSIKRVATAAERKQIYEQNFPIVYTKNCRKRKLLTSTITTTTATTTTNVAASTTPRATNFQNKKSCNVFVNHQQHRKRKPKSLYYKMLHTLRRLRSSNLMRQFSLQKKQQQQQQKKHIAAAAAERHLPLIKRQSIKKYAIANSIQYIASSYFNPKTLKSLSVSILNTEKFRQRVFPNKLRAGINLNLNTNFVKNICDAVKETKIEALVVSENDDKFDLHEPADTEITCNMASQVIEFNDELVQTKEVNNKAAESNIPNIVEVKQELITTTIAPIVTEEEAQKSPKPPSDELEEEPEVASKQTECDMQHDIDNMDNELIVDNSKYVAEKTSDELKEPEVASKQTEFDMQHDIDNMDNESIVDNSKYVAEKTSDELEEPELASKQTECDMQHDIDNMDKQSIVDNSKCVAEETEFELAHSLQNLTNSQEESEDVPERQYDDLNASQSNIINSFSFKDVELNEDDDSRNVKVIYSKEQKIVYDYSSSTSSEEDRENSTELNAVSILKNDHVDDEKIIHDETKTEANCTTSINTIKSETFDDASNCSSSSSSSSSSSDSDTTNDTDTSSGSSDNNETDIDADDDTTTTTTSSDESDDGNEMLALQRELTSTQYATTAIEKTVKTHQNDIDNIAHDDCKEKSIDATIEAEKQKIDITKKQITSNDIANLKKVLEGVEENEELHAKENENEILQSENDVIELTEMLQLQNENDVIEITENVVESEKSVEFVERRQESVQQQQQFLTEIPSLMTLAKTVVDEQKLLAMAVENFTIPKLSDLCKYALKSSCNENITTTTTLLMLNATDSDDFQTLLDENVITIQQQQPQQLYMEQHHDQQSRELSVEEALAEMYRQAGVASDPEDFGETDDKEAQEVLLINLEEILVDSDSDNLYVLRCDMNENILGVITQTTENNDENVEQQLENDIAGGNSGRVNTLELIELFHDANIKETTPNNNNNIPIINTNDNLIISTANDPIPIKFLQSSPTSPDPDYNPSTAFIVRGEFQNSTQIEGNFMNSPLVPAAASISTTTSTNLPPVSDSSDIIAIDVDDNKQHNIDDYDDANTAAHFDLPPIHHEEIVPDNYKSYQNEKFLKYLHAKYVQKNISKFYHANRIIKKYKKRLIKKLFNAMEVDSKNSRCGKLN